MNSDIRRINDDLARLARQEKIIGPLSEAEERERARLRELLAHLYDDEIADWDWWEGHEQGQQVQASPARQSFATPMGMDEELSADRRYLVEYDRHGRQIGRRKA